MDTSEAGKCFIALQYKEGANVYTVKFIANNPKADLLVSAEMSFISNPVIMYEINEKIATERKSDDAYAIGS